MRSLASFLPDLLKRVARDEEVALLFLCELWPELVGKELAARTRPLSLQEGTLLLGVTSETWKGELSRLAPRMAESINRYWGLNLVGRVQLRVGKPSEGIAGKGTA